MVASQGGPGGDSFWHALLGYLNFSEGRPDPRFQKHLNDACRAIGASGAADMVSALAERLRGELQALHASGASAFRDIHQAGAVLDLVFGRVLPAYQEFHADLLAHQAAQGLFQPFFLARVFEAVLGQGPPWEEKHRLVRGSLTALNDFVGYRPVAILETRPRGEPYEHERCRPIPLYLRGAGVASGRYEALIGRALEILQQTDPGLLAEAQFDPQAVEELALDPRAYDHGHPANRRPNYNFGEWDPHHIDSQGRYRRFVVRQLALDSLLLRVEQSADNERPELLTQAAIVLAAIVLMASGVTGSGPNAHDSTITLGDLFRKITAYRDAFYRHHLKQIGGPPGERLREEAKAAHQPFAGVRTHFNQGYARHRAAQLQQRQLAVAFADMGYPEESRTQALLIPTASVRFMSEILIRLSQAHLDVERSQPDRAAVLLPEAEELLQRGIQCGALVDPWNILGFQGLFPLANSREDSTHDQRVDELVDVVERLFDLYARLLALVAVANDAALSRSLRAGMKRLAEWWDPFASVAVGEVRRVHGGEAVQAAEQVAMALARWRQQGEASAALAFWKKHLHDLQSARAFARVVGVLLDKKDYRAALALLVSWLSQAEAVPLEDGPYSYHELARRWLVAVTRPAAQSKGHSADTGPALARKFFDYLEANAEEYGEVPSLARPDKAPTQESDEDDDTYRSAYEGVVYRDSTADGNEGAILDEPALARDFELEELAPRLEKRLQFLASLAELWQIAAHAFRAEPEASAWQEALPGWLKQATANRQRLVEFLDSVHRCPIPQPLGGNFDSNVEYDRRRVKKDQLLENAVAACLETALAVRALQTRLGNGADLPAWEAEANRLEQALWQGAVERVQERLPPFLEAFRAEPLLIVPLSAGGAPEALVRTRVNHAVLRNLLEGLPRLGLWDETCQLIKAVRIMEGAQPAQGSRRITEFERFFRQALQGVLENLVDSAAHWEGAAGSDRALAELLQTVVRPFYRTWIEHSRSLQLSNLERIQDEDWQQLRDFIERYGRDLFDPKFMALGNLRAILHCGVATYLENLLNNPPAKDPPRLLEELDRVLPRAADGQLVDRDEQPAWTRAVRSLERIGHILLESYEEYKDYKSSTPLSDYGDNLHILLDFMRLKVNYDRQAWNNKPLVLAHEVLTRRGRTAAAALWEAAFSRLTTQVADKLLEALAGLEKQHGLRLRTVSDRLNEKFIKPLAVDRLCALVGPALAEVGQPGAGRALASFQEELNRHAAVPSGSGLDVPAWLQRLHQEVDRVRSERTAGPEISPDHLLAPVRLLSPDQVRAQLEKMDKDADGNG